MSGEAILVAQAIRTNVRRIDARRRRLRCRFLPVAFGVLPDDAVAAGDEDWQFVVVPGEPSAAGRSELKLVDVGLSEARAEGPLQSLDDVDPECDSLAAAQDLDISRVPQELLVTVMIIVDLPAVIANLQDPSIPAHIKKPHVRHEGEGLGQVRPGRAVGRREVLEAMDVLQNRRPRSIAPVVADNMAAMPCCGGRFTA